MQKSPVLFFGLLLVLLAATASSLYAQQTQFGYRLSFANKAATNFTLQQPLDYLSPRSIARRQKFGIAVDSADLPVCAVYIDSVIGISNGVLHCTSKWLNTCVVLLTDTASLQQLRQLDFVSEVKPVGYFAGGLHNRPLNESDTAGRPTDFDQNYYGPAWNQTQMCGGEYLHQQGYMGQDMIIAVLDVGYRYVDQLSVYDSLFLQNRLLDTWNFIIDTSYVFDYGTHGTTVLSNMAAYAPDFYVGTAPKASYLLYATDDVVTEYSIEEDNWTAAAERADSVGADLITASLGYTDFDDDENSYSYADLTGNKTVVARAANAAARKGILPIVAAGNTGTSSWNYIVTPADADSAMAIGSVNAARVYSSFSGKGPNAAGLLKPNVCAQGQQNATVQPDGSLGTQTGTSQATPVIAGLTACLLQAAPTMAPMQLRSFIESVSSHYAQPNFNVGNGIPDFKKALISLGVHNAEVDAFLLYPNPANDNIYVRTKEGGSTTLQYRIVDLQGRQQAIGTVVNGQSIATDFLPSGIFMLFLEQKNGKSKQCFKIAVMH